ncbi:MAG TPA: carbamoyltransferase [Dehalococcoidia bacterium]|nr:carbamoyltransferase [Dehalococcoidia bacterium]
MLVLGINCYSHDSSAALLDGERIVFAAAEERFSRIKKDRGFPVQAIRAALDHAGVELRDLDAVAFGWNRPGATPLHSFRQALRGEIARSAYWTWFQLLEAAREQVHGCGRRRLRREFGREAAPLLYIDHHEAHAWSAFALSGFDDALVLVLDGRGGWQATTIYHGREGRLLPRRVYPYPQSLGLFYEAFTDLLGFERLADEWKVMGLAAYGRPTVDLRAYCRRTRHGYRVNGKELVGRHWSDLSYLLERFGPRRNPEEHISQQDKNLAAAVQQATEEALFSVVHEGVRRTGSRNLCLAGGVAMNSKANGKLLTSGLIDRIFVQPAATDDGTALGAALGAYAALGQAVPRAVMEDAYFGPEYGEQEIEAALRAYKLPWRRVCDVTRVTARLLCQGQIVGWFQGRVEFGPRALGNRSILADPRRAEMKDRVNESVKFREGWRPFAPSCLEERMAEYFTPAHPSPFMILTFDVRPDKRDVIPAVTHADGSARVQTVGREVNPRYWELIAEFDRLSGVPVLLNTSFNLRGEPIVCSPKDAIRTFYSSGLDFLVLGDFVVTKGGRGHDLLDQALTAEPAVGPRPRKKAVAAARP